MKDANSMADIRKKITQKPEYKDEIGMSLEVPIQMIHQSFKSLQLHGKNFRIFSPTDEVSMKSFLVSNMQKIDKNLTFDVLNRMQKAELKRFPLLSAFFDSHCQSRLYTFSFLKCTQQSCGVCRAPRSPPDIFAQLRHIPDPCPVASAAGEAHFQKFRDIYHAEATSQMIPDQFCPSAISARSRTSGKSKTKTTGAGGHGLPFKPNVTAARRVKMSIDCHDCGRTRLLYSHSPLSKAEIAVLSSFIEEAQYVCGGRLHETLEPSPGHEESTQEVVKLRDVDLSSLFSKVYVRPKLNCTFPMETVFFELYPNRDDFCYFCGLTPINLDDSPGKYPVCSSCLESGHEAPSAPTKVTRGTKLLGSTATPEVSTRQKRSCKPSVRNVLKG
jgi:hypothetical protein